MRISIEGNVGAGKTTLLAKLAHHWTVRPEPVQDWQELLTLFYADPHRWAFAMNAKALVAFLDIPPIDKDMRPVVVERSPLSCKEVFSRMHLNEGTMTSEEWDLLSEMYERCAWCPDVIIYLKSTPGLCMGRVRQRSREGEDKLSQEYLAKLQLAHKTMLRWFKGETHIVDASQGPDFVFARVMDILKAYDTWRGKKTFGPENELTHPRSKEPQCQLLF